MIGLITATMVAAFMSTHDSYLLCWSSVITQDIIAPLMKGKLSAKARIRLARIFIVLIGFYIFYWGLFYEGGEHIWDYMVVTGSIYMIGSFMLLAGGLYWKRASSTGAVLALLAGFSAVIGLEPVQKLLHIEKFSTAQIGLISVGIGVVMMVGGSLLFPDKKKDGVNSGQEGVA